MGGLQGKLGIFIKSIQSNGGIAQCGQLEKYDEILVVCRPQKNKRPSV